MDGLEYSTRFPFGAISAYFQVRLLLVSGSVYVHLYHPTIHIPSYQFSPTLHGPYLPHIRHPPPLSWNSFWHHTSISHTQPLKSKDFAFSIDHLRHRWRFETHRFATVCYFKRPKKSGEPNRNAHVIQSVTFFYPLFGGHQPTTFEGVTFSPVFFNSTR